MISIFNYMRTIKAMLSGPGSFQENETNTINFQEIPSHVLNKGRVQNPPEKKCSGAERLAVFPKK